MADIRKDIRYLFSTKLAKAQIKAHKHRTYYLLQAKVLVLQGCWWRVYCVKCKYQVTTLILANDDIDRFLEDGHG